MSTATWVAGAGSCRGILERACEVPNGPEHCPSEMASGGYTFPGDSGTHEGIQTRWGAEVGTQHSSGDRGWWGRLERCLEAGWSGRLESSVLFPEGGHGSRMCSRVWGAVPVVAWAGNLRITCPCSRIPCPALTGLAGLALWLQLEPSAPLAAPGWLGEAKSIVCKITLTIFFFFWATLKASAATGGIHPSKPWRGT